MTVISYPVPLYANVPIQPEFYQPSQFIISAIALGQTTLVTTSVDNNYVVGQQVRLIIPPSFGTYQLNGQSAIVLSIPAANQVEININSSTYDAYISSSETTQAQILAIGDINSGQTNNSGRKSNLTYIPGSFINISPL